MLISHNISQTADSRQQTADSRQQTTLPLVSVIIPVYNVEKYLRECVDSVVNQTYKNLEIILVDDGSPDSCPAICDEYAEKDDRVVVIHQKNAGVSAARNAGLDRMTGDWVGFVDSDDYIDTRMYEKLVNAAIEHNADVAGADSVMFDRNGFINKYDPMSICELDGIDNVKGTKRRSNGYCTRIYSTNILGNIRFPLSLHGCEDAVYTVKSLTIATKGVWLNEQLYYYRMRISSSTNRSSFSESLYSSSLMSAQIMYNDVIQLYSDQHAFASSLIVKHCTSGIQKVRDKKLRNKGLALIKENLPKCIQSNYLDKSIKLRAIATLIFPPVSCYILRKLSEIKDTRKVSTYYD